jgi:TolB-like protein/Tfp pilus assembly protein PilF
VGGAARWFYPVVRGYTAGDEIKSLAVLPLENLSGDPAQDYFADGVTDELITNLARIHSLQVISRTSVMRYKGVRDKPLPQIARELGVDAVIEGTLIRSGNRVRVTAQLIAGGSDRHLWAERYERSSRDIILLEDEISNAIAEQVRGKLNRRQDRSLDVAPIDPAAHEAYLHGLYLWNRRTPPALLEASRDFTQAIEIEPRYAAAYSGRAEVYSVLASWVLEAIPPEEALRKAKPDCDRALELDKNSAEAYAVRGAIRWLYEWDAPGAEMDFQRAIELSPSYSIAHQWYGMFLCDLERAEQCLAETARAHALDPAYLIAGVDLGIRLYDTRRYSEAIAPVQKVLEFNPDFMIGHLYLGQIYEANRMYSEARAELRKAIELSGGAPANIAALGHASAVSGDREEARNALHRLEELAKQRYVSGYESALIRIGLGEKEVALDLLKSAVRERSSWMTRLNVDSRLDPLRGDPRFTDLLRRVGLAR